MAKKVIIKQYATFVRKVEVVIEDNDDIEFAAEIVDGLPLDAEKVPADEARVVSDWDYIQDSEDYEDEYGNPICV